MKHLFTTLCCSLSLGVCVAQTYSPTLSVDSTANTIQTALPVATDTITSASQPAELFRKNGVKMNLSSLAFNNYSFSAERAIGRKITVVGGYSFLPKSNVNDIPFVNKAVELAGSEFGEESEDIVDELEEGTLGSQAITGEIRFYGGKKAGARGIYVALYGRYTTIDMGYQYVYTDQLDRDYDMPIQAKMKGFGGGIMFGAQWLIAKRVTFDWYIVGGHYGKLTGDLSARTDLSAMSQEDKDELKNEIEDMATINGKKYMDVTVNDNGAFGDASGPFAGIRGLGFNIGIAF